MGNVADFLGFCNAISDDGSKVVYGAWGNDEGLSNAGKVEVIENEAILSIRNVEVNSTVALFPNPNKGKFSLDFSKETNVTSINVMDALGKTVFSETNIQRGTFTIDENFTSGVYFVHVVSSSSQTTLKMIVE